MKIQLVRENHVAYKDREPMDNPSTAAAFFVPLLRNETQEVMVGVTLCNSNRMINHIELHRGCLSSAKVEPRQILQAALLDNAAGIMICHNHPSGDTTPSAEDVAYTQRLVKAADVLGIRFVDHVIVSPDGTWDSLSRMGEV